MFYRWRRMEEEDRARVWRLYGWFSGLMACGSCIGAVAWAARMMDLVNLYKTKKSIQNRAEEQSAYALANRWYSAFLVTYAIEFMCLSAANLMVLDRMSAFAALRMLEGANIRRRWEAAARIVMAAVVLGNAVGLAGHVAAAVHYHNAYEADIAASAYYTVDNTKDGDAFKLKSREEVQLGGSISSVQRFSEVSVLLLIVIAFLGVGLLSARHISATLFDINPLSRPAALGRTLRWQILVTTGCVFVAFLFRSVFSTMSAVVFKFRDFGKLCPGSDTFTYCDASCYNVYTHIVGWIFFTPEFESMVILISSPLTLLVALWGMTPRSTLQLMKSSGQESAILISAASLKIANSSKQQTASMLQSVLVE
jgi:hypothetical protein